MKRSGRSILIVVFTLMGIASVAGAQTYDATADFSEAHNNNVNGVWSYRQGVNSQTLLDSVKKSADVIRWQGNYTSVYGNFPYISKNISGTTLPTNWTTDLLVMHPAVDGTESVLRWTAPATGSWHLLGYFQNVQDATSDVRVLYNSKVIFSGYINRNFVPVAFDSKIAVIAGDIIEFAVGFGGNNWFSDGVGLSAKVVAVPASIALVSGKIAFDKLLAIANPQTVTFTFRPTDGTDTFSRTLTLPPTGEFEMKDVPQKAYTLHIKPEHHLAKNVVVDTTNGDVSGVTATLLPGDANNDNHVDIFDLATLAEAFNAQEGDPNWNANADFNGNHEVSIFDLAILAENFNQDGDL